jgi:hypothetical protein
VIDTPCTILESITIDRRTWAPAFHTRPGTAAELAGQLCVLSGGRLTIGERGSMALGTPNEPVRNEPNTEYQRRT